MASKFLFGYGLMIAATVVLQFAFGDGFVSLISRPGRWTAGGFEADIAIGVVVGLSTVLLSRWLSWRFAWSRRVDGEFRDMLAPIRANQVFGLAAMSALAEELLFRGFFQPIFGLSFTALAFGFAHPPNRREMLPWTLAAVTMGFVFGGLVALRGSIVAPVVAHFLVNFFNMHHLMRPLSVRALGR